MLRLLVILLIKSMLLLLAGKTTAQTVGNEDSISIKKSFPFYAYKEYALNLHSSGYANGFDFYTQLSKPFSKQGDNISSNVGWGIHRHNGWQLTKSPKLFLFHGIGINKQVLSSTVTPIDSICKKYPINTDSLSSLNKQRFVYLSLPLGLKWYALPVGKKGNHIGFDVTLIPSILLSANNTTSLIVKGEHNVVYQSKGSIKDLSDRANIFCSVGVSYNWKLSESYMFAVSSSVNFSPNEGVFIHSNKKLNMYYVSLQLSLLRFTNKKLTNS